MNNTPLILLLALLAALPVQGFSGIKAMKDGGKPARSPDHFGVNTPAVPGLADTACDGPARPDCQNVPAGFKRVYKVSPKDADADGFVRKVGHIDLPCSPGRQLGRNDDNEFILLHVPELLSAR